MSLSPYVPLALAKQSTTALAQNPPTSDLVQIYADSDGLIKSRKRKADGTVSTSYVGTASGADAMVTVSGTQTVYNKFFGVTNWVTPVDAAFWIVRYDNQSVVAQYSLSQLTSSHIYTFPDASGTFALVSAAQTVKNKTFNGASNTVSNVCDSRYTVCVSNSGTQSIASGTVTAVTFNQQQSNKGGTIFDGASTFTAPVAGLYMFSASVQWPSSALGERRLYLASTGLGTPANDDYVSIPSVSTGAFRQSFTRVVSLAASAQMSVAVYHTATGGLTIGSTTAVNKCRASLIYLGVAA